MKKMSKSLLFVALSGFSVAASALEYSIGESHTLNGMEIAAVYLQPVVMSPEMGLAAAASDIHLEADIHALDDNPNGFPAGSWVPDLDIQFELTKQGDSKPISGIFDAMVASDGPHYGSNVKLAGPGKYHLKFTIKPPGTSNGRHFMRHIDKETGVAPWFETFTVEYDFVFAGVGKKGGY